MKIIAGLGNPGTQYERTRHNAGFRAIDFLISQVKSGIPPISKFKAECYKGRLDNEGYLLLKPQTFMNVSGFSVLAALQFYKTTTADLLVVFDDLDLPPGNLRYRQGGGHGGHNGIRNIIQTLANNDFHRLKIGIGRPKEKRNVASFVLSKGEVYTEKNIESAIEEASVYLLDFIRGKKIQISPQSGPSFQKKT